MVFLIDSGITPESIGAVNAAGGVMKGPLEFVQDDVRLANLFAIAGWAVALENYDGDNKASLIISAANGKAQIGINGAFYDVLHAGNMNAMGIPKVTVVSNESLPVQQNADVGALAGYVTYINSDITENSICIAQERVAVTGQMNRVGGAMCFNGYALISFYGSANSTATLDLAIINM